MESMTKSRNELSHELRTPLMGILGCAEILQRESLTLPQSRHVSSILQAGKQLLQCIQIIEQLTIDSNVKKSGKKKLKRKIG